jgi:hypothetical protein
MSRFFGLLALQQFPDPYADGTRMFIAAEEADPVTPPQTAADEPPRRTARSGFARNTSIFTVYDIRIIDRVS